jgi:uncharacterized protein (TIGR02246 family)
MTVNIEELGARLAIRELSERYAMAVTCRDWAAVGPCFHESARWAVPGVGLAFEGRQAIAEGIRGAVEPNAFHMLMTHALVIDTLGENRATARAILHEVFQRPGGEEGAHVLGVYNDIIVKQDGAWLFEERRFDIHLMNASGFPGQIMIDYATLADAKLR